MDGTQLRMAASTSAVLRFASAADLPHGEESTEPFHEVDPGSTFRAGVEAVTRVEPAIGRGPAAGTAPVSHKPEYEARRIPGTGHGVVLRDIENWDTGAAAGVEVDGERPSRFAGAINIDGEEHDGPVLRREPTPWARWRPTE